MMQNKTNNLVKRDLIQDIRSDKLIKNTRRKETKKDGAGNQEYWHTA